MNTKKIFFAALVAFGIQSNINAQSTDPNVLLGLNDPAYGVQIRTNWPGGTSGWARGFSIVNQDASERFITLGARGQVDNGISSLHYSWIGRDHDDTFMAFLPNGYIGIGRTNPTAKLDIYQGSEDWAAIIKNGHGSGKGLKIQSAAANNTPVLSVLDNYNTTRFQVNSNGNIGVGTSDPKSKLHVEGKGSFGYSGVMHIDWTNEANWNGSSNKWSGYLGFNAYRNNDDVKDTYYGTNPFTDKAAFEGSNYGFRWMFRKTNNRDSEAQHTLNEYMRLTRDGSLAIGTDNPGVHKLAIAGDVSVGATGNASLFARHINGKKSNSFDAENLYINYGTGHDVFIGSDTTSGSDLFVTNGNIGIGTHDTRGYLLAVAGKAVAEEVNIMLQSNWPDFVFEKEYNLPTLAEVENHITEKGHLKDIPSAAEVEQNGIFLGEMDSKLLQKIEELTLYTIAQEKKIKALETQNTRIEQLEKENAELKKLFIQFKDLQSQVDALKK
ncbi:prefoldin domain-containing protein [Aquimarina rhabdastrellae]